MLRPKTFPRSTGTYARGTVPLSQAGTRRPRQLDNVQNLPGSMEKADGDTMAGPVNQPRPSMCHSPTVASTSVSLCASASPAHQSAWGTRAEGRLCSSTAPLRAPSYTVDTPTKQALTVGKCTIAAAE